MIGLPTRLVVFDMAGTIVDHGCMAPIAAIMEAFASCSITISVAEARGPMGLHKRDHIREVLRTEAVSRRWRQQHERDWTEDDVEQMYLRLLPRQAEIALEHAELVPAAMQCLDWLREHEIKVAATTGYPRSVADPILQRLAANGFAVDASCCADEVPAGRPQPWMIFRVMEQLEVYPPAMVVKVGDTVPDMQAGLNAGAKTIGVTETGSEFGLSAAELEALPAGQRESRHAEVEAKLRQAGAQGVIRSLLELPSLLDVPQGAA